MRLSARFKLGTAIGLALASLCGPVAAQQQPTPAQDEEGVVLDTIVLTAEEQNKQAPGASVITADDIEKDPPARDLSEVIRKMPGVNLTGNSASGARGNNRQIDIRGMGPENTLILIDGKPVLSRNAVRYSISGERDTRGDTNWVPPELIERIEVIRGPAAARYGSGASGGVVNIITKRPTTPTYTFSTYVSEPQDQKEGGSRRATFTAAGPLNDTLGYRFSAGWSESEPDATDLNGKLASDGSASAPAGREGVSSYDVRGLLSWATDAANRYDFEAGWSRQRNKYAGDVPWGGAGAAVADLAGTETNRMTRKTVSVSHYGDYAFGTTESVLQYERTDNHRLGEGAVGRGEGTINTSNLHWTDSTLDNVFGKTEFHLPLSFGAKQTLTLGADFRYEKLNDPGSVTGAGNAPNAGWVASADRRATDLSSWLVGLYAESNIELSRGLTVTPGLRFDRHEEFGNNVSPSLNVTWEATPEFTVKGGIARAFKAPNAYQLNPNYLYTSRGNGCWQRQGPCYILGNPDLDPEVSVNKEIGINYHNEAGWNAGATYFQNDYKNKITSGRVTYDTMPASGSTARLMRWENSGKAEVSGIEGNLTVPITETLSWTTNFTKMIKSEDEDGQPLSMIPEHTVNTWLTWQATDRLGLTFSATHYGKTEPPTASSLTGSANTGDALDTREAYWIANLGVDFDITENSRLVAGINNLFDEQLLRDGNGANTYNEPGRSVYVGLTTRW